MEDIVAALERILRQADARSRRRRRGCKNKSIILQVVEARIVMEWTRACWDDQTCSLKMKQDGQVARRSCLFYAGLCDPVLAVSILAREAASSSSFCVPVLLTRNEPNSEGLVAWRLWVQCFDSSVSTRLAGLLLGVMSWILSGIFRSASSCLSVDRCVTSSVRTRTSR